MPAARRKPPVEPNLFAVGCFDLTREPKAQQERENMIWENVIEAAVIILSIFAH
jgi:hypothetical protein